MEILAFLLGYFAVRGSLAAPTPVDNLDPYSGRRRITFRSDGTFKITVFSDLHFGENAWDTWGPQQDVNSTILMNEVLSTDKPDYVVFNGDQITGENTFRENSSDYINEVLAPVMQFRIPFSTIGGNHDNSNNITHLEEIERELSIASDLSYTRIAAPVTGDNLIRGPSNYWVPVYANEYESAPALVMWFFDSRDSNLVLEGNETQIDDWIDESIASWIESETTAMNTAWGPAEERGALVFMHIPPHDLQIMQNTLPINTTETPGLNADVLGSGSTQATNYPQDLGKDAPAWTAINTYIKNIHAVTFGHDHGDSWCARDPAEGVVCCFAKHSGYGGYDYGWGRGVRNFQFHSPNPEVPIDTWVRMQDGEIFYNVTLNSQYM